MVRQGCSLVELLVALGLGVLTFGAIMDLYLVGTKSNLASGDRAQSLEMSMLLVQPLEQDLRALAFYAQVSPLSTDVDGTVHIVRRAGLTDTQEAVTYRVVDGSLGRNGRTMAPARVEGFTVEPTTLNRGTFVSCRLAVQGELRPSRRGGARRVSNSCRLVQIPLPESFLLGPGSPDRWLPRVEGCVEAVDHAHVTGWAFDPATRRPVSLTLLIDGDEVGTSRPMERPDLTPHLTPTVGCGFAFTMPPDLEPGLHRVEVMAGATSLGVRLLTQADDPVRGRPRLLSCLRDPFGSGWELSFSLWAFDANLPDGAPLTYAVEFRGDTVATGQVANSDGDAVVWSFASPSYDRVVLPDADEGGLLSFWVYDQPSGTPRFLGSFEVGDHAF